MEISSPEEPGPTDANPIPIEINFEDGVDQLNVDNFVVTNGEIEDLIRGVPEYKHLERINLADFPVRASFLELLANLDRLDEFLGEKIRNSVISVDSDSSNQIYYLTYGNGVFRYDPNGADQQIVPPSQFSTPLDMVIDNQDRILIADPDNYRVRVYKDGSHLYDIGEGRGKDGNEFYGPTGLAINEENVLYVADAFTGSDPDGLDQVKLYQISENNATFIRRYGDKDLDDPFRIAVDINNFVYVSDAGGNSGTGRVLVFNNNDRLVRSIAASSNNSPGSLIVDDYGYLYVANFEADLNFTDIYQNPDNLISDYDEISNNSYPIDVYSPFPDLVQVNSMEENLDLPVDLALDNCGLLYINNLDLGGSASLTNINASFDFDLEIFKRQDNFTANVVPESAGLVEVELSDLDLFKCEPQPEGKFSINYEVDDPEPTFTCPDESEIPDLALDENCEYEETDFSSVLSDFENFENEPFFEENIVREDDVLLVNIQVYDGEDGAFVDECNFEVELIDNTAPSITSCLDENPEVTLKEGETYTLPDFRNEISATDNCDEGLELVQEPAQNTPISETTTVTITAIDDSGNQSDPCTFQVIIEKAPDPSFTCPDESEIFNLALDENCEYEETDFSSVLSDFENFENEPFFEENIVREDDVLLVNIQVYDGEDGAFVDECNFEVELIDNTAPSISSCLDEDPGVTLKEGETYTLPDFRNEISATDNCDENPELVQEPAQNTSVSETTTVTITAIDDSGNQSDPCTFQVIIEKAPDPSFTCPDESEIPDLALDENCEYEETDFSGFLSDFENFENEPFFEENIVREDDVLLVNIQVYDGEDGALEGECGFQVELLDNTPPQIDCPDDMTIEIPIFRDSAIVEFEDPDFSDNCPGVSMEQTGGTRSGENFTEGTTIVKYTATDAAGNETVCTFTVLVVREGAVTPPQFENCPDDIIQVNDPGECGAVVNFSTPGLVEDGSNVQVSRIDDGPESGELFPVGETVVTFQADDGQNEPAECSFIVSVYDAEDPLISCLDDQKENRLEEGVEVPDYRDLIDASDNCEITEVQQIPAPGEIIYENTEINIIVGDASGNFAECSFMLNLSEEEVLDITCPGDQEGNLDENCRFEVPDFTTLAAVNNEAAEITQSPEPGEYISESTNVVLMASVNGETNMCSFELKLNDDTAPVASCVAEYRLQLDENGLASLSAEDINAGSADNCEIEFLELSKYEFTTADLGENTIEFTVTDASGNSNSCESTVVVEEYDPDIEINCISEITLALDENGQVTLDENELYEGNAPGVEFQVSQGLFLCTDLGENIIEMSYNGAGVEGSCEINVNIEDHVAPVASCVPEYHLRLDENGFASLSAEDIDAGSADNCEIESLELSKYEFTTADLGENTIEFRVTDASGNFDTCEPTVIVEEYDPDMDFECVETLNLQLDNNGEAVIGLEDLYTGNAEGLELTADKLAFDCGDIGVNAVTLQYEKNGNAQTCEIEVMVEDNAPPVAIARDISITLDQSGTAVITSEDIDDGSFDNCDGGLEYSLSRTRFDCKHTGNNFVELRITDSSGNTATTTALVFVNANPGTCSTPPDEEDEDYLFVYPNPTAGDFKISTPQHITVQRLRIFDKRGRYIGEKEFRDNETEYEVRLEGVRNAVYTLQLFTSDGEYIKRIIIRR